jgi:hypothetical protein
MAALRLIAFGTSFVSESGSKKNRQLPWPSFPQALMAALYDRI